MSAASCTAEWSCPHDVERVTIAGMDDPTFTILMPVLRPPVLMPFAIQSVLRQTRADFELLIVCDGAPPETIVAAEAMASEDGRIRVLPFPKGERNGEAHRHTVLEEARGRFVCQLADDDLWLPNHLEELALHLSEYEFGNLLFVQVSPEYGPYLPLGDLADPAMQRRMTSDSEIFNLFGPSQSGYRMDTYRRLPVGWTPAPPELPSDLFMWRKFLALPDIRVGTRFALTSIGFASALRPGWGMDRRREEIAAYAEMITEPGANASLLWVALRGAARLEAAKLEARDYHRQQSENWQEAHRQAAQVLAEVEAARDHHQRQSEDWQDAYRQTAEVLERTKGDLAEAEAARDARTLAGVLAAGWAYIREPYRVRAPLGRLVRRLAAVVRQRRR